MPEMEMVRVPASSANLGPGFDTLAVALGIYLECRFRRAEHLRIRVVGRDSNLIPTDPTNLVWRTAMEIAQSAGLAMSAVELDIHNEIPVGKGLGSSAAALTAGVVIADRVLELGWTRDQILDEVSRLEGHPDNAAACVLGSIVVAGSGEDGKTRAIRLEMPPEFRVAAVVPNYELPTSEMRAVLPECYSGKDTIFNLQRTALLVAALARGDRRAFPLALEDRLHQPYRSRVVPGLEEILELRMPGLLGCSLSGAGPAVLVFVEKGAEGCAEQVQEIFRSYRLCAEVLLPEVARHGYTVGEATGHD